VGRVWQEVEGTLAQLPAERATADSEYAKPAVVDELAARRRARRIG
jgi:hypothetical protein